MRLGSLAALLEWHDDLPTLCSAEVNTSPRSFVTASDFKAERLAALNPLSKVASKLTNRQAR